MDGLSFEWDERKNAANQRKHGVSFAEARTAFLDENARVIPDPEHSAGEERFVLIGLSISVRVLVVCHCTDRATKLSGSSRRARRTAMKPSNIIGG